MSADLSTIAVVLNRPRFPENIGAAARAMRNMGLSRLIVVAPENRDDERIRKLATHAASGVVDGICFFDTLSEALGPFQYIVGTSARLGRRRQAVFGPERAAATLVPMAQTNQVGILFGPEDRGLTNEELRLCHQLVYIPTADFSSINLAQAVMIVCYELFKAGQAPGREFEPRLAARFELDQMYAQVEDILIRICYIQADQSHYRLDKVRRFLNRFPLQAREVSIIRGICRQILWYGEKRFADGRDHR